jgi:hypothetical protein
MGAGQRIATGLIAAALIAALAVGCGGGSGSTEGSVSTKGSASTSGKSSKSEPSAEFAGKTETGKLATLGKEGSPAEREAASQVIEESFKAREAGNWKAQCASLAKVVVKQIEKAGVTLGAKGKGCTAALEAQAAPVPAAARANTLSGPIDALRVNGAQGYAFYHGTGGKDYSILLLKEGNDWKLAALQEKEAP